MSNIYLKVTVEKDWLLYICSAVFVYAENGLLPPVINILSFVLLNVRGMVQVVTWYCWHTIYNTFIHFIIMINKGTGVFIKNVNYCSWFFQGFFVQFLSFPGGLGGCFPNFGLLGMCGWIGQQYLQKQRKDGRALGLSH